MAVPTHFRNEVLRLLGYEPPGLFHQMYEKGVHRSDHPFPGSPENGFCLLVW